GGELGHGLPRLQRLAGYVSPSATTGFCNDRAGGLYYLRATRCTRTRPSSHGRHNSRVLATPPHPPRTFKRSEHAILPSPAGRRDRGEGAIALAARLDPRTRACVAPKPKIRPSAAMGIELRELNGDKRLIKDFLEVAKDIYKGAPNWVRPL